MEKKDFDKPVGLSRKGTRAYNIIMKLLGPCNAGGCKVFYSPAEWKARGEEYGTHAESQLIVVYDGGDHGRFFSLDRDYPHYKNQDKMRLALEAEGLYFNEATCWYGYVSV